MRMPRAVQLRSVIGPLAMAVSFHGIAADASAEAAKSFRPAYHNCLKASGGVTAALNDCIGTEHEFQDKRLNAAYQTLRKALPEPQRLSLRDEERAWISDRDKKCAPARDGGTGAMIESNQCVLAATAERAVILEGRVSRLPSM